MSSHSQCPSGLSIATCHPVDTFSHPLSPDQDYPTRESFITSQITETQLDSYHSRRKAASIRSSSPKPKHRAPLMRRSTSSSGSKPLNDRDLIFDEWITSTAHPALAAHSLIPSELVDDDKAVQDMLAEAMNEEHFTSVPSLKQEEEQHDEERPPRPMSAIDIPLKKMEIEAHPRSSSSLSLRKWGIFVGRGESGKHPATPSAAAPARPKLTQKRSFSAPDNSSTTVVDDQDTVKDEPTPARMSPSSSNEGIPSINVSSPKTPSKPTDTTTSLHRTYSAPEEESLSLDQMRTEASRTSATLRPLTRLRATTLSTTETRSRSGSESTVPKPHVLSQSSSSTSLTSLGQRSPVPIVELDTIVPAGIQPPSLSPRWNDHYKTEESGLTDRYGFIIARNQRRTGDVLDLRESLRERTRSDEERWTNVAIETEDRIEELRKLGAKETRVSSTFVDGWNTPVKGDTTPASVVMMDMRVHSPADVKVTSPLINEIIPVDITVESTPTEPIVQMRDPAPLTPSLSVETPPISTLSNPSDLSTIKLLLSKLNDLHDSLDRANKQRWDKWLSQSDPTDSLLTLPPGTKDRKQRFRDFKLLIMGGIPVKYRSKIWAECSGATELSRPGYFEELCALGVDGLDKLSVQQIEMDIHRTMPNNVFFGGNGPGIVKLERVLIAFSRHNPSIGYCQGMNVITATLLLVHSTDEEAFWGLVAIIERILPEGYFTPDLIASRADQRVLKRLVRELSPRVHLHLKRLGVDLEAITFNWFLSVFTDCLPAEALFRVWDVFFVEGSAYIFRVALSVIKINEKMILACKTPASVYSFMKDMTSRMLPIDKLITMSCEGLEKSVRNDLIEGMRKVEIEGLKREMEEIYR